MAKKALVIGATGLVGFGIVRELIEAKYSVTALSRGRNKTVEMPQIVGVEKRDRTRPEELHAAFSGRRWDLVVDCAAYIPAEVEAMAKLIPRYIGHYFFISSDFVYNYDPEAQFPTAESETKVPIGPATPPYALSKWQCEQSLIRAYDFNPMPLTILRPPHVIGAGKPLGCDPVAGRSSSLLEQMRAGKSVPLLVEGKMLIQPIYSRELGRMIAQMAGNARTWGQAFNTAGDACVTTAEYYRLIAKMLGIPLNISSVSHAQFMREHPDKSPFCRHRCYDMTHLKLLTGYKHFYSLEEGIVETMAWMGRKAELKAAG